MLQTTGVGGPEIKKSLVEMIEMCMKELAKTTRGPFSGMCLVGANK